VFRIMSIDFLALRAMLVPYCERAGIRLCRSGESCLVCKCPIHHEKRGASFVVFLDDHRWRCFGKCDKAGDVIDLDVALYGGRCADAVQRIEALGLHTEGTVHLVAEVVPDFRITHQNPLGLPYQLSSAERAIACHCARRLAESAFWLQAVCKWRGWEQATIRGLALEGSLGVDGAGRLCYLYDSGCKVRYSDLDTGDRVIKWRFGKPSIWRAAYLKSVRKVYLTEGETDAISLIDEGVERDAAVLVVATPCAGFNVLPYASLFAGKEVVLVPDPDEAGLKAGEKWAHALEPQAKQLCYLAYHNKEVIQ
jgi:hypothetical protein